MATQTSERRELDTDGTTVAIQEHLIELNEKHLRVHTLLGDINRLVEQLRAEGASWAMIGREVGITPQAAHQRWSLGGKEKHRIRQLNRLGEAQGEDRAK
jgi:hypothetical protein